MKQCFKCKETKPLDDFYRHPGTRDGLLNKCKACTRADATRRHRDPSKRALINATKAAWFKTDAGRLVKREVAKRMRLKYPEKIRARRAASRLPKQPCERCGAQPAHAHHTDYSKPLDVMWLCPPHHREWHAIHQGLFRRKTIT